MVRRCEFALGKAIRAGQERGEIGNASTGGLVRQQVVDATSLTKSSDLIPNTYERTDIYAMSDGVEPADFEEALSEARAEGNVSRVPVA